ncbi:MAG: PLP-dependent aminotransferase family protein [Gammaproteobacteria bacterium]|nr:PLP-dependent aminotransferase family protein [Gammaproteobacteria bacterium]
MAEAYLYQQVANELQHAIRQGVYGVGDRLPSLRHICQRFAVSLATAVQAYDFMSQEGLIESRPKRGYFVRHKPTAISEPAASKPALRPTKVNVAQLAMSLINEGRQPGLVKLGAAVPGADILPLGALARAMAGVARRRYLATGLYEDARGNSELRTHIARLMQEAGVHCRAEEVIITNGCLEALGLALRVVAKAGDTIAIESPTYFGILQTIESLGLKALEIPTHARDGIDLDALRKAIIRQSIKACVLVPTFNNPLGSSMPDKNRRQLVQLLAQHDIPLIEDDEYGFLSYNKQRPKALKSYDRKENVIYCSSFSKTVSPGLRLGWMIPGRYMEQIGYTKFLDNISTAIHPQLAMTEFLERGNFQRNIRRATRIYQVRMEQLRHWVSEFFPAGTRLSNPEGGFLLWVELPEQVDSEKLYQFAMQQRIAITPGMLFTAQAQYKHHIRLSCGAVDGEQACQSIQKLGELARRML